MLILALALAVAVVLALFNKSDTIWEHLSSWSWKILPWTSRSGHGPYNNSCLTRKSYGFPSHQNTYNYWKNRPKSWATEYSVSRIRGDIDKVRSNRSNSSILGGSQPAPSHLGSVHSDYYHDPVSYCQKNPHYHPCPNNWIPGKHSSPSPSAKMDVPGLLKGQWGHVKDRDIDDNYHIHLVDHGREDHGQCGRN